jgi:hypothetical protein
MKASGADISRVRGGRSRRNCTGAFGPGLLALLSPAGCSQAPSQNILGSFFPSWLLCGALGLAAALVCRIVLGTAGLDKTVLAPPLGYLAVAVAVTSFVWLLQFGQ